ncbi:MAG: hypothetical protein ABI665_09355 [Vicinamibacterales bacterium]
MTRGQRLVAFERLLATPDPPELGHRGHCMTHAGHPLRFESEWLSASRAWLEYRLGQRRGIVEGWKPAVRRFVRPTRFR